MFLLGLTKKLCKLQRWKWARSWILLKWKWVK